MPSVNKDVEIEMLARSVKNEVWSEFALSG